MTFSPSVWLSRGEKNVSLRMNRVERPGVLGSMTQSPMLSG
jgi:hypothetical protein